VSTSTEKVESGACVVSRNGFSSISAYLSPPVSSKPSISRNSFDIDEVFDIIIFEFAEYVRPGSEATLVFVLLSVQAENTNEIINSKTEYFFIEKFLQ
jgi:hypothetical protein